MPGATVTHPLARLGLRNHQVRACTYLRLCVCVCVCVCACVHVGVGVGVRTFVCVGVMCEARGSA